MAPGYSPSISLSLCLVSLFSPLCLLSVIFSLCDSKQGHQQCGRPTFLLNKPTSEVESYSKSPRCGQARVVNPSPTHLCGQGYVDFLLVKSGGQLHPTHRDWKWERLDPWKAKKGCWAGSRTDVHYKIITIFFTHEVKRLDQYYTENLGFWLAKTKLNSKPIH